VARTKKSPYITIATVWINRSSRNILQQPKQNTAHIIIIFQSREAVATVCGSSSSSRNILPRPKQKIARIFIVYQNRDYSIILVLQSRESSYPGSGRLHNIVLTVARHTTTKRGSVPCDWHSIRYPGRGRLHNIILTVARHTTTKRGSVPCYWHSIRRHNSGLSHNIILNIAQKSVRISLFILQVVIVR